MCSGKVGDTSEAACGVEAAIAAGDRGVAGDGYLHEEKIVEPIGIDLDFGAVFQPVDGRIALTQVIHARLQGGARPMQAQEMRLENAGDARAHGVEITRREDQGSLGKQRVRRERTAQIDRARLQAVTPSDT
jgi:hypothetical protein